MSYKEKIHALKLISEAYAMQDEKATSTIAIKQRERRLAKKRQEEEREMMELEDDFSYQLRLYARKLDKMEEERAEPVERRTNDEGVGRKGNATAWRAKNRCGDGATTKT